MKILFLMIKYDEGSNGLYEELVEEFVEQGNEIYIATINERRNGNPTELIEDKSKKILRIKTGNMFKTNFIEKGLTTISLGYLFKKNIKKYWSNIEFDVVIQNTPPITFTPVIKWLKQKNELISYLILRDIFPQNALDLGIIKNKFLFNYFRKNEKELYKFSDLVGCMSKGNIEYLLKHNSEIPGDKVHILRNWGKIKEKINIDRENLRKQYNYQNNDFILVFGGNMGKPQELDFLLEIARELFEEKNIKFLFIGQGTEQERLKQKSKEMELLNVKFIDFIPREEYEKVLAMCDLGVISLSSKFTIPNIPSKTIDYFKLELPVIAFVDNNTDYSEVLELEARAGLCSLHGDIKKAKENILKFQENKELRERFGKNGREYYERYLGVDKAYRIIMEEINKLRSQNV